MEKAGITVRFWQPDPGKTKYQKGAINHAKVWSADGKVTFVGSANGTVRSLVQDWEIGLLFSDPQFAKKVERDLFAKDLKNSVKPKAVGALKRYTGLALTTLFGPILRLL